ncbi:MAG: hypothetical protein WAK16_04545 [Candidatus Cybelea sp.]|jgi:hypothetical protein
MERACGFDRSDLYSDEGPPIGDISTDAWVLLARPILDWVLRSN